MNTVAIIPARFASSRYPGKALVPLQGRPMVLHVAEICATALGQDCVYVATESERIASVVRDAGFHAILTSDQCLTGTDRLAEASRSIAADVYINVQGDEPLLDPEDIRRVAQEKAATPTMVINCYHELGPDEDPESPNIPKVIFNEAGMMVYMSRRALPGFKCAANKPSVYHKQVCIYGFSGEDLKRFSEWGRKGTLEWHEDIEILRFLEIGVPVRMIRASRVSYAVDMPEDAAVVESMLRRSV